MGIPIGAVAVGIPSSRRDSRGGPGIPESISNFTSSLELRSFHVDSIALQEVFCELICI